MNKRLMEKRKNGLTKYSQKLKTIQLIELKRRLEILS